MKKCRNLVVMLLAALILSGCVGRFNMVRKVYDFNMSAGDKWVNEIVFLGMTILPIYSIAALADAVVFNSIEFWTGNNPVALKVIDDGEYRAVLKHKDNNTIMLSVFKSFKPTAILSFEKTDAGIIAKTKDGDILYKSISDGDGGVSVLDSSDQLVKYFSADEVAQLK